MFYEGAWEGLPDLNFKGKRAAAFSQPKETSIEEEGQIGTIEGLRRGVFSHDTFSFGPFYFIFLFAFPCFLCIAHTCVLRYAGRPEEIGTRGETRGGYIPAEVFGSGGGIARA